MPSDDDLHSMTFEELGQLFPIIICEPSDNWPEHYRTESGLIVNSLSKSDIVSIDHIGSTAIPNLKAKPTIDILLQISENADSQKIIETFKSLGYQYTKRPENPPPHMMFVKGYSMNGFEGQAFHVHIRYKGDWDEIHFRDYLVKHRKIAKKYEELKLKLAIKYKNDREAYTNAKTEFIEKVNRLARK